MSQFPIEPHSDVLSSDSVGGACCVFCRTEFDARRPQGCPICAITRNSRQQTNQASPKTPSEEERS